MKVFSKIQDLDNFNQMWIFFINKLDFYKWCPKTPQTRTFYGTPYYCTGHHIFAVQNRQRTTYLEKASFAQSQILKN